MPKRIFKCLHCHGLLIRNGKYDAYWCPRCDRWAEATCGEESCEFCRDRPTRPSEYLNMLRAV